MHLRLFAYVAATTVFSLTLAAQDAVIASHPTRSPISVGDYPNVAGLRMNFRDRDLERVIGINVTIWDQYHPGSGYVRGLALGLPLTGAKDIDGAAIGILGAGVDHNLNGIGFGLVGTGGGGNINGIALGGIGVGAGGNLRGIVIGGIGAGAGGRATGIIAGGIGAGVGGDLQGIAIGGIGVGAGGNITGVGLGGIGVGAGGNFKGIAVGGIGVGAGGNFTGIGVGGIGVGAGGTFRGAGISLIGVGSPHLRGIFAAMGVGASNAEALIIAPAYFRIHDGTFRGVSISTVNDIRGSQSGLSIGLVNYARSLNGLQVGLINIIADQSGHPFLPLLNWGSR